MTKFNERTRVVEEWLRLPESRRRHATDAVAFAYRLEREHPDIFCHLEASHENIVDWLLPYLNGKLEGSSANGHKRPVC